MTCVVGLIDQGIVYLAADSAGTSGNGSQLIRADRKVFGMQNIIFGFSGSFRVADILKYSLDLPTQPRGQHTEEFMKTAFIDSVRKALFLGGAVQSYGGQEMAETSFLVGYGGRIFNVQADYQVGESVDPFAASGAGADVALGSLYSSVGKSPEERLKTALESAERFNSTVRRPFVMVSLASSKLPGQGSPEDIQLLARSQGEANESYGEFSSK